MANQDKSQQLATAINHLSVSLNTQIFGQKELVEEVVCGFLAGGHVLITGAPGLAKTTLVRTFATETGLQFGRIQFTPDLLPTDITGCEILHMDTETGQRYFNFHKGPIFANILLADEINRASPRTQSALLEAMQEKQLTVAGKTYPIPDPFVVLATQNPFESEGTFPLPEAQLDRFLIHSLIDYPSDKEQYKIFSAYAANTLLVNPQAATSLQDKSFWPENFALIPKILGEINVSKGLLEVINSLITSTRPSHGSCPKEFKHAIISGASPRAGIALIGISRAFALLQGSPDVTWQHIKRMATPVLRHRIRLSLGAHHDQLTTDKLVGKLLEKIETENTQLVEGPSIGR